MDQLRIGLAGYGNWARLAYVPTLRKNGRGRIVASAAATRVTRQRIVEELGSDVRIYSHFQALLDSGDLDAVLISVPDTVHEAAVLAAIVSEIPFFYEPPLSDQPHRSVHVMSRLLGAQQVTQADLELRFVPVVAAAARLLAEGAIGEPQSAIIKMQGNWNPTPGVQISLPYALAPWYVDALNLILGSYPQRVLVQDGRGTLGRMQSYAITQLDYSGIWGTFHANISSVHGPETWIEVNGRDGDLFVDIFTGELRIKSRSNSEWQVKRVVSALQPFAGWPGLRECLVDFLNQLTDQPFAGVPAEDMTRLHLVGLAAEDSINNQTRAPVRRLANFLQASK